MKWTFLISIMVLSLLSSIHHACAMEHVSDSDSDFDDENQSMIIIDMTNYGSVNNSSKKEYFITPLLIAFLNHYLPREILLEKIIPYLISSKKFMLVTNPREYKQDRQMEELVQEFETIDLSDEKGDQENDAETKIPKLSDREIILQANVKQLNLLNYPQKQRRLKNILKCMNEGLFDKSLSQAILIFVLSACNQDFSLLSQEEKEAYSLADLIALLKTTFDYKTIGERALITTMGTPNKIKQYVCCIGCFFLIGCIVFIESMAAVLINTKDGTSPGIFVGGIGLVMPLLICCIYRKFTAPPEFHGSPEWQEYHYYFDEADQELG